MDSNMIYNIFLFIVIPLLLTLVFADKKSKGIFGFLILGISVCLLAAEVNALIYTKVRCDFFYYSTTLSPMVEEILKAIPLGFAIFFVMDDVKPGRCVSLGLAIGVGFAIFENIVLFIQADAGETLMWSFLRGIGAGLMHGICGGLVGFAFCFVKNCGKGYFFGLLGVLSSTMIYHGIYNVMVQSESFKYLGIALPVVTTILLNLCYMSYNRKKKQPKSAAAEISRE